MKLQAGKNKILSCYALSLSLSLSLYELRGTAESVGGQPYMFTLVIWPNHPNIAVTLNVSTYTALLPCYTHLQLEAALFHNRTDFSHLLLNLNRLRCKKCTEISSPSGAESHRGEAHRLECWSPGLRPRIPPWCRPSHRRRRREVCPLPGSLRPRAAAGLCVGGGSAAGAQTHVEINSHL